MQRRILHRKVAGFGGLVTHEAVAATRDYLDRFIADRLEEGWRPREVSEAYYGFERVRYWASAGVRRASVATDLWSPFVSRDFIRYCLSLTPQERTVEAPHWRILGALDERLRDHRFEYPWRAQRPRLSSAMVGRDVARKARAARARGAADERARGPPPFGLRVDRGGAAAAARAGWRRCPTPTCGTSSTATRLQALLDGPAGRAGRRGGGAMPRAHGAVVAARPRRGPEPPKAESSSTPPTAVMLSAEKLGKVMLITIISSSDGLRPEPDRAVERVCARRRPATIAHAIVAEQEQRPGIMPSFHESQR